MDYLHGFTIASAGMALERARVETAALNLAHAAVPQDPAAPAFVPLRVVARPAPPAFDELVARGQPQALRQPSGAAPRLVLEPGHPLADAQGLVAYPGVDTATEMVTLMSALRAYEANLAALATSRTLALKTLEIGRSA